MFEVCIEGICNDTLTAINPFDFFGIESLRMTDPFNICWAFNIDGSIASWLVC
jgi:hypothetical protein